MLPEGTVVELGDARVEASGHTWAPARGGWLALTHLAPIAEEAPPRALS